MQIKFHIFVPQMNFQDIHIEDYNYPLPDSRIALYPLPQRDQSKLLLCENGKISADIFSSLSKYLAEDSLIVFNDTKVIHARLLFKKETGSKIEIFCLEPVRPSKDHQLAFSAKSGIIWKCFIGNNKKWKQGKLFLKNKTLTLSAEKINSEIDSYLIRFEWDPPEVPFASVIEKFGKIPLPPYIDREVDDADNLRYQTMFAHYDGSVAAPTAGLHFTDEVLASLHEKKISESFITLHVGAGTFKPVSSKNIADHSMHEEFFSVKKTFIENLLKKQNKIIAVGTTAVRTLESLYWSGCKLVQKNENPFTIGQWLPYENIAGEISFEDSMAAILKYCDDNAIDRISGSTRLMIVPGYDFHVVNEMITNFHQPKSTLLLLVSAFIGQHWKEAYNFALKNDFRFLSYGDVCYFRP
jgi:S-adenosylmethionine:tRNA ribosyltransferase-isomerase